MLRRQVRTLANRPEHTHTAAMGNLHDLALLWRDSGLFAVNRDRDRFTRQQRLGPTINIRLAAFAQYALHLREITLEHTAQHLRQRV